MANAKQRMPVVNLDNLKKIGGSYAWRERQVDPEDPEAGTETYLVFDLNVEDEKGNRVRQRINLTDLDQYQDDDSLDSQLKGDIAALNSVRQTFENVLVPTVLKLLKAKQYELQS